MSTQTIGLFEAKTHLSELVARAEQGEEVIITRHNKPVAKIVPMGPVSELDVDKRRRAIAAIEALRETLRRKHGTLTSEEIVDLVRQGRKSGMSKFSMRPFGTPGERMAIVLDCSYAMSLVLPGERPPRSRAEVLDEDLIAPHLFPLEVANAALKSIRRKRYPIEDARDMCEAIERLNISVLAAPDVGPGYHLRVAQAHGLTAYDAVYLDLALNRRCGIATCDAQLAEAARKAGVPVYL